MITGRAQVCEKKRLPNKFVYEQLLELVRITKTFQIYDTITFSKEALDNIQNLLNLFSQINNKKNFQTQKSGNGNFKTDTKLTNNFNYSHYNSIAEWIVAHFEVHLVNIFVKSSSIINLSTPIVTKQNEFQRIWRDLDTAQQGQIIQNAISKIPTRQQIYTVDEDLQNNYLKKLNENEKLIKIICQNYTKKIMSYQQLMQIVSEYIKAKQLDPLYDQVFVQEAVSCSLKDALHPGQYFFCYVAELLEHCHYYNNVLGNMELIKKESVPRNKIIEVEEHNICPLFDFEEEVVNSEINHPSSQKEESESLDQEQSQNIQRKLSDIIQKSNQQEKKTSLIQKVKQDLLKKKEQQLQYGNNKNDYKNNYKEMNLPKKENFIVKHPHFNKPFKYKTHQTVIDNMSLKIPEHIKLGLSQSYNEKQKQMTKKDHSLNKSQKNIQVDDLLQKNNSLENEAAKQGNGEKRESVISISICSKESLTTVKKPKVNDKKKIDIQCRSLVMQKTKSDSNNSSFNSKEENTKNDERAQDNTDTNQLKIIKEDINKPRTAKTKKKSETQKIDLLRWNDSQEKVKKTFNWLSIHDQKIEVYPKKKMHNKQTSTITKDALNDIQQQKPVRRKRKINEAEKQSLVKKWDTITENFSFQQRKMMTSYQNNEILKLEAQAAEQNQKEKIVFIEKGTSTKSNSNQNIPNYMSFPPPYQQIQQQSFDANCIKAPQLMKKQIRNLDDQLNNELYCQIDNQITKITSQLEGHQQIYVKPRQIVKNRLGYIIQKIFNHPYIFIQEYGSLVTGLLTPFSDMDLAITSSSYATREECVNMLKYVLQNLQPLPFIKSINPILTANVPVLKIEADPHEAFHEDETAQTSIIIKIDLIVEPYDDCNITSAAFLTTDYVKKCVQFFHTFYANVLLIKYSMVCNQFNNVFNGFLIRWLQRLWPFANVGEQKMSNNGEAFLRFLGFFSKEFDVKTKCIHFKDQYSQNYGNYKLCVCEKTELANLVIYDPTSYLRLKNVTPFCSQISEIQAFYGNIYDNLQQVVYSAKNFIEEEFGFYGNKIIDEYMVKQAIKHALKPLQQHKSGFIEALLNLYPISNFQQT